MCLWTRHANWQKCSLKGQSGELWVRTSGAKARHFLGALDAGLEGLLHSPLGAVLQRCAVQNPRGLM